jgi:nucleoside-diphosphate-sugar epimerase
MCVLADLSNVGDAYEITTGADAIVHLAAIPAPGIKPAAETFRNNTISTYNIFAAAIDRRVERVVWASSETVLGLPFDSPPAFAPIDESHPPRPETSYALSKLVSESMADQVSRRSGIPFMGLRISNIMEPADYVRFASWQDDARVRKWNLWGYVDARDVAQAVRLSLKADLSGADTAIVAAADTCMLRTSAELMAEVYPTVSLARPLNGRETLLSIERARQLLGYSPAFSWTSAGVEEGD